MLKLRTYRARLIFYIGLLIAFLAGTLLYYFYTTRGILMDETEDYMSRTVSLLDSQLVAERNEILRYAEFVRDDLRIQEYMYVVVSLDSDTEPLSNLYHRQFGWLPIDRGILLSPDGRLLMGDAFPEIEGLLQNENLSGPPRMYHLETKRGLELLAIAPVHYRSQHLGYIVLSRTYDIARLWQLAKQTGGNLFIVQEGIILNSSMPDVVDSRFSPSNAHFTLDGQTYRLQRVELPGVRKAPEPELWFGISETRLTENIARFTTLTMAHVLFSALGILVLGLFFLRNFNRPISQLMAITDKVSKGELPAMEKYDAHNEVEHLSNQIADMLRSLRSNRSEIERVNRQLSELAITDSLTGLYNRRYLLDLFPKLLAQARRDGKNLDALMFDIDHFKNVNDTYGHLAGDECLMEFATVFREHSRANDFLFRTGGEEFLVVTISENINGSLALAEKIREAMAMHLIRYEQHKISLTLSCGIGTVDAESFGENALTILLKRADSALYEAKEHGRNQCWWFDGASAESRPAPRSRQIG